MRFCASPVRASQRHGPYVQIRALLGNSQYRTALFSLRDGEVLRHAGRRQAAAAGGRWDADAEGGLGIHFDNGNWCFPIAKVAKQFADGAAAGESILSFYDVSTTLVAKGSEKPEG